MRLPIRSWSNVWGSLWPSSRKRRRAHRIRSQRARASHFQHLEPRQLLTGTLQLLDGATTLTNGGSDSFGSVSVGDVDTKNFTVENVGTGTLTVNSVSLPNGYSTSTAFPLNVAAGQSATFAVSLYTGAPGTFNGTMTLQDSDSANSPFSVNLSGTVTSGGSSPSMTLRDGSTVLTTGASDSFGSVSAGTADSKSFSVSNSGSATLTVSNVTLPNGFTLGTAMPLNVPPGQSSTFVVTMNTTSSASYGGQMVIADNDSAHNTLTVNISGTVSGATAPSFQLLDGATALTNGGSDSFGTVNVGASDTKTFTVRNTGSASLTVSGVTLPGGYTLQSAVPLTVPAGGSTGLTVALNTSAAGSFTGPMTITDSDSANATFTVNLSGTVTTPPAPVLELLDGSTVLTAGASDSFGSVVLGGSDTKTFSISNTGNATLTVSGVSLPSGFSLQGTLPTTVAAGTSDTFTVAMDTSTARSLSAPMVVTSNDSHNPLQITLSGTVTLPPPVISVLDGATTVANGNGSDPFGSTLVGVPLQKSFTIANSGTSDIALTAGSLSLPQGFSLQGTWPASVPAGGSATFTVQLDATAAGNSQGMLSFSDADPGAGNYRFNVSGLVTAPSLNVLDRETYLPSGSTDDFGSVTLGLPLVKTFTLMNSGNGQLSLTPTSLLLPAGFSLVGTFPSAVPAGGSATFQIQLDAKTAGSFGGAMSFTDSDPQHSPYVLNLTGQVTPATGAISVFDSTTGGGMPVIDGGSTIAFGSTDAGQPLTQTFTIKNTGQAALSLDASTLMVPAGFSVATPFDASVAPGASTALVVQLDATLGGDFSGLVSFDTSDPNHGTFSFLVGGHVNPPTPGIAVFDGGTPLNAGSGYDSFGVTTLGTPVTKTFTIENTGTAALTLDVNSLTLPTGYSLVTPFAASVPAGGSTTLVIELTAAAGGTASGQVSFTENVSNQSPFTFNVSGLINAPAMTVTNDGAALANGGTVDFGDTPLSTPVTRTLVIGNSGTADLTLDPTSLSLPTGYSLVSGFASNVPPHSTTSLVIQLNATAAGTIEGQVSFNDNDPGSTPFRFLASGTVTAASIQVLDGAVTLPASGGSDDFGVAAVGTPLQKTFTIENVGGAPLAIDTNSLTVPTGFSIVTLPAASVPAGGSTTLVVQMGAASAGLFQGVLEFSDSDPVTPEFELNLSGQANTPAMEVRQAGAELANGAALTLGSTARGTPLTATFSIADTGAAPLTIDPATIQLPDGFSMVSPPSATVAAGAATTLVVQLDATAAGSFSGALSFNDNDAASDPYSITISGTVTAPQIVLLDGTTTLASGTSDSLGSTTVGTAVQKTFTIENVGADTLTLADDAVTLPAGYSLVSPPAASVLGGAQTTFTVQLDATDAGSYSGNLSVVSNDSANSPYAIALSAQVLAAAPTIEVFENLPDGGATALANNSQLTFPAATVGTSVSQTLTIDNVGGQPLTIDTGSISLPAGFSVSTAPAASVPAGGQTSMVITLSVATAGTFSGPLVFNNGDTSNSPFTLTLSGTVSAAAPSMAVLDGTQALFSGASTLAFPSTAVGTAVSKTLTIENTGTAALNLGAATVSDGFAVLTSPAASVAPGKSTTLTLQLTAAATGNTAGTLTIPSDDPAANPFALAVSGVVVAPAGNVSLYSDGAALANGTGSDSFGSTTLGAAVFRPYVIQNTGTAALTLDPASLTLPAGFSVAQSFGASTLAANAATTLVLRMDASAGGDLGGVVSFGFNDGAAKTFAFNISGTVTFAPPRNIALDNVTLPNELGLRGSLTTADPTVSGVVDGELNGGNVVVQFDTNADGMADASLPAVMASGTSFTFDPRTVDAGLNGFLGAVDIRYRDLVYDASGELVGTGAWTDLSFTMVAAPTAAHVDQFGLVNDTGASSTDANTYDPRVSGTVNGPFVGASVDVQFDDTGAGTPTGSVYDVTAPGSTFVYNPVDDDPALINFTGAFTLHWRTVEHDASGNVVLTGDWQALTMTLYAPAASASVSSLHLVNDTGASNTDKITSDPTLAGTVTGGSAGESVDVQFSHQGDGTVNGWVTVDQTPGDFSYDPLLSDPALASFAGSLPIEYRTVEHDALGGAIYGPWISFPITLALATSSATISNLHLANVTGAAGPPPVTSDPHLTGTVVGAGTGNTLQVQFQLNGDGQIDDTTTVSTDGTFTDALAALGWGVQTVAARVVEWSPTQGIDLYGAWTSITFDHEPSPPAGIATLALANVTDTATGGTSDPTVEGQTQGSGFGGQGSGQDSGFGIQDSGGGSPPVSVEFDTNSDGVPDGEALLSADGTFSFTPIGLTYGSVTIAAREADHDPTLPAITYSAWKTLTFTYEPPAAPAPTINDLRLSNDDGSSATDNITSDPTITGRVTLGAGGSGLGAAGGTASSPFPTDAPPSPDFLPVEIDTNADDVADFTTTTGPGGTFTFTPTGLAYGPVTVSVRAISRDAAQNEVYGVWTSLSFTYQQAGDAAASVASLTLTNALPPAAGAPPTDPPVASDPTITGQVARPGDRSPGAVAALTVEIDTNADGTPDATVLTDEQGNFSYTVPTSGTGGLAAGTVTINARVRTHNYATSAFDYSGWTPLTFTYQPPPPLAAPAFTSLGLADDSGDSASDGITANPTISGQIELPPSAVSGAAVGSSVAVQGSAQLNSQSLTTPPQPSTTAPALVQIDYNGDDVPDVTLWADNLGNFTYTLSQLPYGPATVNVRTEVWNSSTNSYLTGAWKPLSFTYQKQAMAAPTIVTVGILDATGKLISPTTSATLTANPVTIAGRVTWQGPFSDVAVVIDPYHTGAYGAVTRVDANGNFRYTGVFKPGPVTAQVKAIAIDRVGNQLLTGNWVEDDFTVGAPGTVVPVIDRFQLADDNGASSTDRVTSDPTVAGHATSSGAPRPLVIQFDINGDATPDASVSTDAAGNFTWLPNLAPTGIVSVAARAVDRDPLGNPLYGVWVVLPFDYTLAAGSAVGSLTVAINAGTDAAPITSDGVIAGQLIGLPLNNVTVQLDTNGDGQVDAVVRTDANGRFTYDTGAAELGLPAQLLRISARVAPVNGAPASAWTTADFVKSANPTDPQVQELAQAAAPITPQCKSKSPPSSNN